jgi:transposase
MNGYPSDHLPRWAQRQLRAGRRSSARGRNRGSPARHCVRVWKNPTVRPYAVLPHTGLSGFPLDIEGLPRPHEHLSAISGVTLDGRLFLQVRRQSYDSQGVIRFLRVLLRKIPGKLLIIWDGAPIHRSQAIKAFLTHGAAKRILLERLPAYAPACNPDEGVWNYLKRVELANVCCKTLDQLEHEVIKARERLRHKRTILQACSRYAGYIT